MESFCIKLCVSLATVILPNMAFQFANTFMKFVHHFKAINPCITEASKFVSLGWTIFFNVYQCTTLLDS